MPWHGMARQIAHVLPVATAPDTEAAAGASGIDLLPRGCLFRTRAKLILVGTYAGKSLSFVSGGAK
jgi:hypothetical protein